MWVGLCSLHGLKLLALQSTANVQKPGTEVGGAGLNNAYHGRAYIQNKRGILAGLASDQRETRQTCLYLSWARSSSGGQRALSLL